MLSNNGLCLHVCAATAQYVLLFLERFNNSDWFQIYGVTRFYSSRSYVLLSSMHCARYYGPSTIHAIDCLVST